MDNWDIFSFELIDNDISVFHRSVFMEEKYVTSLHRGLHGAGKNDDNRTLSPQAELHNIPDHDCACNDKAELQSLINELDNAKEMLVNENIGDHLPIEASSP